MPAVHMEIGGKEATLNMLISQITPEHCKKAVDHCKKIERRYHGHQLLMDSEVRPMIIQVTVR